jgi:hypothetical protein
LPATSCRYLSPILSAAADRGVASTDSCLLTRHVTSATVGSLTRPVWMPSSTFAGVGIGYRGAAGDTARPAKVSQPSSGKNRRMGLPPGRTGMSAPRAGPPQEPSAKRDTHEWICRKVRMVAAATERGPPDRIPSEIREDGPGGRRSAAPLGASSRRGVGAVRATLGTTSVLDRRSLAENLAAHLRLAKTGAGRHTAAV